MSKYEDLNVQALNARIAGLIHRRNKLNQQIEIFRKQRDRLVYGSVIGRRSSGTQDKQAVPTVELRPYVIEALKVRTVQELARDANVAPRTIHKIRNQETNFTTLRIADMILTACGQMEALGLTVRIIGNPLFRDTHDCGDSGT